MKQSIVILAFLVSLTLVLSACSITNKPVFETIPPKTLATNYALHSCNDWGRIAVGPFTLENNVWNKGSRENYTQCVFASNSTPPATMGWSWSWPADKREEVVAYPELIYGDKPWSEEAPSDTLPIKVSDRDILVSYNAALKASGVWNMAFSMWLTRSLPPREKNISKEIMIWTAKSGMLPAGYLRDRVSIGGIDYKIYINENHIPAQDGSTGGWTYITFLSIEEHLSGTLNLGEFLGYLLDRQYIEDTLYLADIELGNEIIKGQGEFILSKFEIKIK